MSPTTRLRRALNTALALLALLAPLAAPLGAQDTPGRISGTITDAARAPVAGAQVSLAGTRFGAVSTASGRYVITGIPAGTYEVRVQRIGQKPRSIPDVQVRAGEETTVDVSLETAATALGGVVVSASRRVEKITDAPATVTSIGTDALDNAIGNTFASALKEAKGVDFIQTGMTSIAINARGFNSSFNNRFLMVEDGRISVLPENGLPVGQFTPTPKVDLAGMEVLIGPGSALYGPDASSGVLSTRTKDPREFPGATLEVTGGSRSYYDVQGRYAAVRGNFGYKVAGEYQSAEDWENYLTYNAGGAVIAPDATVPKVTEQGLSNPIDWKATTARGTGAFVWYNGANRLELNGGMSRTDGVGQTNVGRNQLDDWTYNVMQARYTTPHWYFNAYRGQSQSGKSFALNRYAGAQLTNASNPAVTPDSLRKLSDWPSDGRMYAAEVQGNYVLPMLLNTNAIFGGQYRRDQVSSDRQWLTDRITGEDIKNDQQGVYAQTTTPLMPWIDVVLAGRYDKPDQYDAQFSPKAGIVVKPMVDQAFRVTFNRAFKSPTILQTDFFIPDWTSNISIYGNTGGFQRVIARSGQPDSVAATYAALEPETNDTWEVGYKGIFRERLFLDATYFRSDYENFMSPLTVLNVPALGQFARPIVNPGGNIPVDANGRIVNQAATPTNPIVLVYYNLGKAKVSGSDVGLNFLATRRIELRGTYSSVKIDDLEVPAGASPEATSLNSPTDKWTVGASAKDVGPLSGSVTWRQVGQYYFRSGSNTGIIPRFGTLDASVSYRVPVIDNVRMQLGVSNLLSCTSEDVKYSTAVATKPNGRMTVGDKGCGFGRRHKEMINMPEIGTMVFLGARWQH